MRCLQQNPLTCSPRVRVALDVHRQYLMVGAVDLRQQVVLSPRRFGFAATALVGSRSFHPRRCSRAGSDVQCVAAV